jgi:hypothetical protein
MPSPRAAIVGDGLARPVAVAVRVARRDVPRARRARRCRGNVRGEPSDRLPRGAALRGGLARRRRRRRRGGSDGRGSVCCGTRDGRRAGGRVPRGVRCERARAIIFEHGRVESVFVSERFQLPQLKADPRGERRRQRRHRGSL